MQTNSTTIQTDLTATEQNEARALRNELLSNRLDMYGVGCGQAALDSVRGLLDFAAGWDAMVADQKAQVEAAQAAQADWNALAALVDAGGLDDVLPVAVPTRKSTPLVLVASETKPGVVYTVQGGRCTCPAGQHGRACKHLRAAAA